MTTDIILETDRLYFRGHILADLDAYCVMEADPDFRCYVGGRPRPREEAEQRFMAGLKPVSDGLSMMAAVYKPENKYIGRCGIYPHFNSDGRPIHGEATLGLYIGKAYWGRGLATEAGRAFVNYGFIQLNLSKIVTMVRVEHDASVHVIKKLGFELVDTVKENGPIFIILPSTRPGFTE
ncbi:MAG TPA: GNAT family N-acetyltransferase [Mucilaginibacter sp.]|jgi:ribosomal-protein-alanine N-acetyltransferase|nr:GNAT family N-acetyltransferase [Mucilaginibacter sp.]